MEITIDIDENLLEQIKLLANREETTISRLIEETLRQKLSHQKLATYPHELPVSDARGGLQPGVDISNSAEQLDIMERDEPLHKLR
jgi:hypothetical protein